MKTPNYPYLPLLAAAILSSCITESAYAQERFASLKPAEFAELWLDNNCGVGEENVLTQHLKVVSKEAEPFLVRAWRDGPSAERLAEVRKVAAARFASNHKSIGSGETFGLSEQDLKVAREQDSAAFVESELNNYILRYKSQALVGLGITAGPEASKVLEAAARQESILGNVARMIAKKGQGAN